MQPFPKLHELFQTELMVCKHMQHPLLTSLFDVIDAIILRASQYKDVTGIFLAQVTYRVYQAMYRETNTPVDREYEHTHGADPFLLSIDDNYSVEEMKQLIALETGNILATSSFIIPLTKERLRKILYLRNILSEHDIIIKDPIIFNYTPK